MVILQSEDLGDNEAFTEDSRPSMTMGPLPSLPWTKHSFKDAGELKPLYSHTTMSFFLLLMRKQICVTCSSALNQQKQQQQQ